MWTNGRLGQGSRKGTRKFPERSAPTSSTLRKRNKKGSRGHKRKKTFRWGDSGPCEGATPTSKTKDKFLPEAVFYFPHPTKKKEEDTEIFSSPLGEDGVGMQPTRPRLGREYRKRLSLNLKGLKRRNHSPRPIFSRRLGGKGRMEGRVKI